MCNSYRVASHSSHRHSRQDVIFNNGVSIADLPVGDCVLTCTPRKILITVEG